MVEVRLEGSGLQTLAIIVLPIALPYLLRAYKQLRTPRAQPPRAYIPSEQRQVLVLGFLAVLLVTRFVLQWFKLGHADIFKATASRLAVSQDLLKMRATKAGISLSPEVWDVLDTIRGRLVYLRVGHAPLAQCTWCTMDQPTSYALFSLARIAPAYLAQLAALSLVTKRRTAFVLLVSVAFAAECYVRLGGFDYINAKVAEGFSHPGNPVAGVLFIDAWLPLLRHAFFLVTVMAAWALIWLDAYLNRDAESVQNVALLLQQTLEDLRVSSSLQRTLTEEASGDLKRKADQFWLRHAELVRKTDAQPVMTEARQATLERLGEAHVSKDKRELESFLEAVLSRLPDYSAAAAAAAAAAAS